MAKIRIDYIWQDLDRHGNLRTYLKLPGRKKVRLRETLGTPAFWTAYHAAIAAGSEAPAESEDAPQAPQAPAAPNSLAWLCQRYYGGGEYKRLGAGTRRVRRGILERCCRVTDQAGRPRGAKPYRLLEAAHVRAWRDAQADRPEAANGLVKALRRLFAWAGEALPAEQAPGNPAAAVPYFRGNGEGFHTWSLAEIDTFCARHPAGSKAALALALLLFTGVRRSNVVQLGPQMVGKPDAEGISWLRFTQKKGEGRKHKVIEIPLLPVLAGAIAACPSGHLTFLVTAFGKPFTANGFGNWFKRRCREAGLEACSAHGLRKAGATIAADAGATTHQLMAIFGWDSIKQAEVYTRQADRRRGAGAAMHLLQPAGFGDSSGAPAEDGKVTALAGARAGPKE